MLLFTHPACLAHDPGPGHPECPARLSAVLEAASHTEFRPATAATGTPVAVSMVWVIAHTTVTGALPADDLGTTGASH